MNKWIAWGQPVETQLAEGRQYLTYAAYLENCKGDGVDEPLTRWQFQASMIRRGLVLAPEDDLDSEWDLFAMLCYPTAKQRPGSKISQGRARRRQV